MRLRFGQKGARYATAALAALALAAGTGSPALPRPPTAVPRDATGPAYVPGEVLVRFRREASTPSRGAMRLEVAAETRQRFASGAELWRLGPGLEVSEAIRRLEDKPGIEYAEPNYLLQATRIPDDPLFPQQYSLRNTGQEGGEAGADIDAVSAWDVSTGGEAVVVAVIDTGIDLDHPDLAPNLWTNPDEIPGNLIDDDGNGLVDDAHGWDFVNQDNDPDDDAGHGTHVAGTIAAAGNNGLGPTGVAWHARLMPLKFLDAAGTGTTSNAIRAIDYAAAKGARILNASWGGPGFSLALLESIRAAGTQHEALFVAAAGNEATDLDASPFYPAGYDAANLVTVGATDRHDHLTAFSNFGRNTVDLAAPGTDILSTLPGGGYGFGSGTSMATPHVSGVAALVVGLAPGINAEALRRRILEHAEPVAALADSIAGSARLNAFQCLLDIDTEPPGPLVEVRVIETLSDGLVLHWFATGDDLDRGAAFAYDMRVSEEPFDASGFETAPRWPLPGPPLAAGYAEMKEIEGLAPSRTYHLGLRAIDEWGNAGPPGFATATTRPSPVLEVTPGFASITVPSGQAVDQVVTIHNASEGTLDWSVPRPILHPVAARATPRTEHWGGGDPFGYAFIDSDEPDGLVFAWRDITTAGKNAFITGDRTVSAPIPIGFSFPFYGQTFTSLQIAADGFLMFTPGAASGENQPLPSEGAPANLVAAFWDDLYVPENARVLWLGEPAAFTVQFTGVMRTNGGGPYTFQIVLSDSGEILFRYLAMTGLAYSETIGLQDGTRTAALPISFNVPYVHDRLAVRVLLMKDWVEASPRSGRLRSFESAPVRLTFDAADLAAGVYDGRLPILANDPESPRREVPLQLVVEDARAIAAEPAAIDFGAVSPSDGARIPLSIVNSGSLPLMVTAAAPGDPNVLSDFAPFSLLPGGRRRLVLEWRPVVPGVLRTDLRIESDAENVLSLLVPLTGLALNAPPRAAAIWPEGQVECVGPDGSDVLLDASPSTDEEGGIARYEWLEDPGTPAEALLGTGMRIAWRLPIGTHRLALRVTDHRGATGVAEHTLTIADTTPPEVTVRATPSMLSPPRHQMVPVRLSARGRDACSREVTVRLTDVVSNEPDDAPGRNDGETTGDIGGVEAGTSDTLILLRAERNARGSGRVYTIRFVATDAAGHATTMETVVTVPSRRGTPPLKRGVSGSGDSFAAQATPPTMARFESPRPRRQM